MSSPKPPMRRREFVQILAGVFVIVFSVRLALVLMMAPEIPFFDEWDAVIDGMARPMLAGNFPFGYFLAPHNEHPVLWTKGLSYLALRAGDLQFDNVAVCEVSQFIYAAIVAALIALASKNLTAMDGGNAGNAGSGFRFTNANWWFIAGAGIAAALPYGWENIGTGWQSSYYFLIGFSTCTILIASVVRGSAGAMIALGILAVAAGVSMGSGLFASVAALLALALRVRVGTLSARVGTRLAVVLLCAIVSAITLFIRAERVVLEWGCLQSAELVILTALLAPTWILMVRILRGQGGNADVAFVCVAVWGFMQIFAILLGRPAFRLWFPISRYVDVLAVAGFANLGCLFRLAIAASTRGPWSWLSRAATLTTIIAALAFAPFAWQHMEARAAHQREQADRVVRYVRAGDSDAIAGAPAEDLPYPKRDRLRGLLDAPDVRLILGDRAGTRAVPSAFVENVRSVNAGLIGNGVWLLPAMLAAGLLSLAAAFRRAANPA